MIYKFQLIQNMNATITFNVTTKKFRAIGVAHIIFTLDAAAWDHRTINIPIMKSGSENIHYMPQLIFPNLPSAIPVSFSYIMLFDIHSKFILYFFIQ